jgi:glycosyltransferase involved in cell wall biosynthesis
MNILIISPQAPPKSSPESIQVGRYLKELDKDNNITLITTPIEKGWIIKDDSLDFDLKNTNIITLHLPFHNNLTRIISSKYFKHFHIPDKDFWIQYKTSYILNQLINQPDVIYSRSMPFSSALLALKLKRKTQLPWIMHLSDPFFDNPYRRKSLNETIISKYEYQCFNEADYITVTTKNILKFYQKKYPKFSDKIKISPNVMPKLQISKKREVNLDNSNLTMIYAGALYGERNLTTILNALEILRSSKPNLLNKLDIKIIGNMTENIKEEILQKNFQQISIIGRLNYNEVLKIQNHANIVISIEPDGNNPILKSFLPSKILDYLVAQKPILAITPKGSESWDICNKYHFGWAIKPNDSKSLATLLEKLIVDTNKSIDLKSNYEILNKYSVKHCVSALNKLFDKSIKKDNL